MVGIADELMSKVAYGVAQRAAIGAGLSMFDMLSDVVMIVDYFATGRDGYAYMLLGTVGANLFLQLLIVHWQTRGLKKCRRRTAATEAFAVVTFVKPGLDAWRVASGAEQALGSTFDPLIEMMMSRCFEMVAEAIPGEPTFFHLHLFLTPKNRNY